MVFGPGHSSQAGCGLLPAIRDRCSDYRTITGSRYCFFAQHWHGWRERFVYQAYRTEVLASVTFLFNRGGCINGTAACATVHRSCYFSHKLLPLAMLPAGPMSLTGTTWKGLAIPRPRRTNFAAGIKQAVSMRRRSIEGALVGKP